MPFAAQLSPSTRQKVTELAKQTITRHGQTPRALMEMIAVANHELDRGEEWAIELADVVHEHYEAAINQAADLAEQVGGDPKIAGVAAVPSPYLVEEILADRAKRQQRERDSPA
ncbi:hypothetical protein GCM10022245_28960 [Streptomyces mayteni]